MLKLFPFPKRIWLSSAKFELVLTSCFVLWMIGAAIVGPVWSAPTITIRVNSTADTNISDSEITLREAILIVI